MKNKRGQSSTTGVSILVLLISFFILLYVILLPPAERAALLNETPIYGEDSAEFSSKVIFSESPGKVYSYSTNVHKVSIEPIHIYSKEESNTINLVKSMSVSRNMLKDNFKVINFNLEDISDLKGAKLFFLISESKGPISIYLNNKLVFDGVLTSSHFPLDLPIINLQEQNKLEFYSASPGFKIFSSNYYLIQDMKLIKTNKVEKTKSARTFYISEDIGENVRRASLKYFVSCNSVEYNPQLTIYLNTRKIFQDTVFCNYLEEISLPLTKSDLNVFGGNRLEMELDNGDLNIDEIRVETELTKSDFPSYTFDISSSLWDRLKNGNSNLVIQMKLSDSTRKKANIFIQGEKITMDTSSETYARDITSVVDNGANSLKLEPLNNFQITNLKILEE
jgi:hypothetical protein